MDKNKYDTNTIRLFALALVDIEGTIAEYISLCKNLWDHPEHNIWVRAAVLKRASLVRTSEDESCLTFLMGKIFKSLDIVEEKSVTFKQELLEHLPSIINLIPMDIWMKPTRLWNALLKLIIDEFQLDIVIEETDSIKTGLEKYDNIALFFIRAIGSTWNDDLDKLLESWKGKPEYEWLEAVKHSVKLNILLDEEYRRLYLDFALNNSNLFEEIAGMKPFDRRRFLIIKDVGSDEMIWPDIKLNKTKKTIEWIFSFSLVKEQRFKLLARKEQIGTLVLFREANFGIKIGDATGFLAAFLKLSDKTLKLAKAAADIENDMLVLSDKVKARLRPVEKNKVMLYLKWNIEGY